ncbi:ABC transporter permease [Chromohalobacter sp. TMW 2.2308]|uniref:ABC transporter permease n=1 Tax=Chromohalobacter moromii TaxID=2860329 RepID=A0A9X2X213_9GAMM|nr:ABC transporter permease [Chromohalobacter moromii]MCK2045262.1 ABC transporter permease [Chromohalobacter moromii]MCT8505071.1 ABC transporter permease [Chromohalobacter moromii]MCT8514634.1 ABC transporter permease [Chromohalobacter sp. TMW 2.2271]
MKALSLSLKGLWRDLRAADVRALFVALALAVAASTMIGFFLDRLDRGLTRQAGQLMGGDLVLEQSDPFSEELRQALRDAGLTLSQQVDLISMVSRDDAFQPASLKVVDAAYPLYGQVRVDRGEGLEMLAHGPAPGSVWVAPRLARLMELDIGDSLAIGDSTLIVSGLIEREPDQSAGFSAFNPRVMMHRDDLAATDLVQPGSRLEYELLAQGPPEAVARVQSRLESLRDNGVEVRDVREDRPRLGGALDRAQRYLSLSGLAAVLLAGVAVAMATRRYVDRHLDTAALLRCFGASQRQLVTLFALQLAWLALAAAVVGALLGLLGQAGLLMILTNFLPLELPPPGPLPLLMGVLTALAVLIGFAGPTLLRLKRVSALKVLRRELDPVPMAGWAVVVIASGVFGALLWLYSGDFTLSLGLLIGGELALAALWLLGHGLLSGLLRLVRGVAGERRHGARHAWRLGARQLARRRHASLGQLLAFSVTFAAMAIIALVRGDLVTAWESQLPEDTPNYFAINIQPAEREGFRQIVEGASDTRSALYPIVRGRLVAIDGDAAEDAVPAEQRDANVLRRELNLTWRETLPEGNRIVAGGWFDAGAPAEDGRPVPISMEQELAERLDVTLGEVLRFDIGGETVEGRVTSLRSLDWESFRPNFFVIFPPGTLERFSHSYITAFHLEDERQTVIGKLVSRYPGVSLLNVDAILEQVRELLGQVTRAIELVLVFVLLAGISVLYAALTASRPMRAHESALLRVFGAGDRMIAQIQGAEFALLGIASGLLGALLAEAAALGVYLMWFDLPPRLHWPLWVVMPLGGGLLIGGIGHLLTRQVRRQAPMESLRLLGET